MSAMSTAMLVKASSGGERRKRQCTASGISVGKQGRRRQGGARRQSRADEHLLEPTLHVRPLVSKDRKEHGIPQPPIPCALVMPQDALLRRADPQDRGARSRVDGVGPEL